MTLAFQKQSAKESCKNMKNPHSQKDKRGVSVIFLTAKMITELFFAD